MKILVTRPEPGASVTAARLFAMGHTAILAPCLSIAPRICAWPARPAAIIVTSGQAVPELPKTYHQIPVFCVGDATAGRLREAGFSSVESAAGDARDLFRLICARRIAGPHLMAVGQGHGVALAGQLRGAGFTVTRRVVYTAKPLSALPPAAHEALRAGGIAAALFYSADSARAFARLKPPGTATIEALALSDAVAHALRGLPWRKIRVALAPTEADLLAILK